jgi:hypothetical protein
MQRRNTTPSNKDGDSQLVNVRSELAQAFGVHSAE